MPTYAMPALLAEHPQMWTEMARSGGKDTSQTTYSFGLMELYEAEADLHEIFKGQLLVITFDQLSVTMAVNLAHGMTIASTTLMIPASVDGAKILVDLAYRGLIENARWVLSGVIYSLQQLHAAIKV